MSWMITDVIHDAVHAIHANCRSTQKPQRHTKNAVAVAPFPAQAPAAPDSLTSRANQMHRTP